MTQLGILPKEWKIGKLGDYCSILGGYAFKSEDYTEEGTPIVRIGNLQNGKVVLTKDQSCLPSKKFTNSLEKYLLNEGDILIALTGATTGKLAVVPKLFKGSLLNQRVGKFNVIGERLDEVFINFYAQTSFFQDEIKHNILQSAQGNISPKRIEKFNIPLPPLPEQKAIAHVLQTIQEAKEKTEEVIRATKEFKKSMMKHLFTYGPVSSEEAERVRLKETEIGIMPEGWKVVRLGDVIKEDIKNGAFIRREKFGHGTLFLNVADTYKSIKIRSDTLERVDCTEEDISSYGLRIGDLVYVRSSLKREGVGQCCLVGELNKQSIFDCHLMRVRVQEEKVLPIFVTYFSVSPMGKQSLIARSKTTTMTTINQEGLAGFLLPLPNVSTQQQIAEILSTIDAKIEAEENKKNALEGLFKTLLHDLMTAKIRANNLPLEA